MTSSHFRFVALLALSLVLCVGLTGCGSKVSKANADKITNGMTEAQVKDILGTPTETQSAGTGSVMVWKSGNDTISVTFMDGKVAMKLSSFDIKGALGVK
jgi:hypothetical protein